MIRFSNLTMQRSHNVLLENTNMVLSDKQKVGIIGTNGCGKSSLFALIKGELDAVTGEVDVPDRLSFVAQELTNEQTPILELIKSYDTEVTSLQKALQTAKEEDLGEIYEKLRYLNAETLEARASRILKGLGFEESDFTRMPTEFSGGWRRRLSLAGALIKPADVLLLDEPTNHLDLEGSLWLASYLKKYNGTLLLISHDKALLNEVCSHILHFENKELVLYSGNYETAEKTYLLNKKNNEKAAEKMREKKEHLETFINRFRYKATKAKQAQSRLKLLEKMKDIPPVAEDRKSHFDFGKPAELPSPVICVENGETGYGDKTVLQKLNFSVGAEDRIALLGKNGNGKSTLAKLLVGELPLFSGKMIRSKKLNIGFFDQTIDMKGSPLQIFSSLMPTATELEIRSYLARFGLENDKPLTDTAYLSGGEKVRLSFAKIMLSNPEMLILDEPSNHLDIQGREALIDALNAYTGAVILITHDFHLLEGTVDDLWLIQHHTLKPFDGDLEAYRTLLLNDFETVKKTEKKAPSVQKELREKALADKKAERKKENDMKKAEDKLEKLAEEKNKILSLMEKEATNPVKMKELAQKLQKTEREERETEELWLSLAEN